MKFARALSIAAAIAVVPRALADAPPGRYTVDADTVKDTKTGLTWKRTVSPTMASLEKATAHCVSPFRVPEIKELQTLVDEDAESEPFIDHGVFDTPTVGLWSNTHTWNHEAFSVFIQMPDGTTRVQYYNGAMFPGGMGAVRCVH